LTAASLRYPKQCKTGRVVFFSALNFELLIFFQSPGKSKNEVGVILTRFIGEKKSHTQLTGIDGKNFTVTYKHLNCGEQRPQSDSSVPGLCEDFEGTVQVVPVSEGNRTLLCWKAHYFTEFGESGKEVTAHFRDQIIRPAMDGLK
jgi:hypothetical protein